MLKIRLAALAAGLIGVTLLGSVASGAAVLAFHVRYFAEGGSYQTYLVANSGAGVAGEAWLGSEQFDSRRARTLVVCDRSNDGQAVRARVQVPDGRRIDYLATVGSRCFVRPLGYPISQWQLLVGAGVSGAVPPPRLI
jgi:hypothetical protein